MGSEYLAVAIEHDLYTNIKVIDVCTEFDIFEVKVPIIFFGTPVFSARRDGRYDSLMQRVCLLRSSGFRDVGRC